MKLSTKLVAAALSTAALVSLALPEKEIAFQPEMGSELWKRFELTVDVALDDVELLLDDQPQDASSIHFENEPEGGVTYTLEVVDRYRELGDGRPAELLRTYEALELALHRADEDPDTKSAEELVGKTVRFMWDDDTADYERSFHGSDGEEALLEPLGEDTDLRTLLPSGSVSAGDEWSLEGAALFALVLPGVDFERGVVAGTGIFGDMPEDVTKAVADLFRSAEAKFTYLGIVEEDGVELDKIGFTCEVAGSADLDPELFEMGAETNEGMTTEAFTTDVDLELEGTCLWDSAAGRFHSFDMSGEGMLTVSVEMTLDMMGQEMFIEGAAEFGVEIASEGRAEVRD